MTTRTVTLRDVRDERGTRYLGATMASTGALTIEGRDYGDGVEQVFGPDHREYEWAWTLDSEAVGQLKVALHSDLEVLDALAERFSNDAAAGLKSFLDEHGVGYTAWSRTGE